MHDVQDKVKIATFLQVPSYDQLFLGAIFYTLISDFQNLLTTQLVVRKLLNNSCYAAVDATA